MSIKKENEDNIIYENISTDTTGGVSFQFWEDQDSSGQLEFDFNIEK